MFVLKQKNQDWWIADWNGDPGRTTLLENAKTYKTKEDAQKDLKKNIEEYGHIRKIDMEINSIVCKK